MSGSGETESREHATYLLADAHSPNTLETSGDRLRSGSETPLSTDDSIDDTYRQKPFIKTDERKEHELIDLEKL